MNLADSASHMRTRAGAHGYAMAALLVAMSVMAIVLSVALPTWKQTLQREKEDELVFRGNQYARAIGQYQRRNANASPPSLDALVEQRFLRKKYKDPVSPNEDGEFQLLYVSNQGTGSQAGAGTVVSTTQSGGIMGVASKSTAESIRIYNGKNHYNEWQFIALVQSTQAGSVGRGGQQGQGRGGTPQPQQPQQQQQGGRGQTQTPAGGTQTQAPGR